MEKGMLILTRRSGERIVIGDGIVVTVVRVEFGKVRLGIEAPLSVPVHREEVQRRIEADRKARRALDGDAGAR
jgi:carbon storage regulator